MQIFVLERKGLCLAYIFMSSLHSVFCLIIQARRQSFSFSSLYLVIHFIVIRLNETKYSRMDQLNLWETAFCLKCCDFLASIYFIGNALSVFSNSYHHRRIDNPVKYLWWRFLQKYVTLFSC